MYVGFWRISLFGNCKRFVEWRLDIVMKAIFPKNVELFVRYMSKAGELSVDLLS